MRTPLRNPRSFKPTGPEAGPEDELKREEFMIIELARHSLREAVAKFAGPNSDQLALVTTAVVGMFSDVMSAMPYAPELAAVVNRQIGHSGWMLVPVQRS
jgi:hypothetical protein